MVKSYNTNFTIKQDFLLQGAKAISGKRFKLIFTAFILLVMKQMITQKEALIFSFIITP